MKPAFRSVTAMIPSGNLSDALAFYTTRMGFGVCLQSYEQA